MKFTGGGGGGDVAVGCCCCRGGRLVHSLQLTGVPSGDESNAEHHQSNEDGSGD